MVQNRHLPLELCKPDWPARDVHAGLVSKLSHRAECQDVQLAFS